MMLHCRFHKAMMDVACGLNELKVVLCVLRGSSILKETSSQTRKEALISLFNSGAVQKAFDANIGFIELAMKGQRVPFGTLLYSALVSDIYLNT